MPNRAWHDLRRTVDNWLDHDGPRLAASLSLYSLLSLAPLVILSIATSSPTLEEAFVRLTEAA